MPSWADLLGKGSIFEQLLVWGILNQLLGDLLGPTLELLRQELNAVEPTGVLTPAQLADMAIKNIMTEADAATEAARNGIDASRFHRMVLDAGEPPGLSDVLMMWRRKIIEEGPDEAGVASVDAAIRTSRIRNEWADAIKASRVVPITAGEAVAAALRNQISRAQGADIAYQNGISAEDFDILVNTTGRPPSLSELLLLARRQYIPWGNLDPASQTPDPAALTFAQGVLEGDTKDKWLPMYAKLAEYIPPPRTITTLLRSGAITADLANSLFEKQGLSPDLAKAYVASVTTAKTSTHKDIALSSVLTMYEEGLVTQAQATPLIAQLGYDPTEITFLLALADHKRAQTQLNSAINRIRALFQGHKIDAAQVTAQLTQLQVPADQITAFLAEWTVVKTANVRLLTPAQMFNAFRYGIWDQAKAQAELEGLGYTPYDAWVFMSIENKAALPNQPPEGPAPVQ